MLPGPADEGSNGLLGLVPTRPALDRRLRALREFERPMHRPSPDCLIRCDLPLDAALPKRLPDAISSLRRLGAMQAWLRPMSAGVVHRFPEQGVQRRSTVEIPACLGSPALRRA